MIVVPRKKDRHPDHCAASHFTEDEIADVTRVDRTFQVDVVNYLVHYNDWMGWFLHTLARGNELFSRPAPSKVLLPGQRNRCL